MRKFRQRSVTGHKLPVLRWIKSEDLMTIVDNTVANNWICKERRTSMFWQEKKKKGKYVRWWPCELILWGILSQCIHVSNHHPVHFKYLTTLFFNYTTIKLGGKQCTDIHILFKILLRKRKNSRKIDKIFELHKKEIQFVAKHIKGVQHH